jgi:hypothetical protein
MQFSSQNSRFLCNRPDRPLKESGLPTVSKSLSVEDVRTSDQHRLDARSSFSNSTRSWISAVDIVWEVSARRLDDVQHSRIFRVSFMSSKRRYSEDRPNARPRHMDVDLLWEELRYFGKAVAVNCPDSWSSRPDALQYFDHNFLLKYRIGMKLVSLER